MFNTVFKFLPELVRTALVGGVLVNDAGDGVVTQITQVTDTGMLVAYVVVALVQLATVYLKGRAK